MQYSQITFGGMTKRDADPQGSQVLSDGAFKEEVTRCQE